MKTLLLLLMTSTAVAAPKGCFDLLYSGNSKGTLSVFERHKLQSGGYTWSRIIEARLEGYTTRRREADFHTPDMPGFGVPMSVVYKGAETWYVLDEEGDGAIFCAPKALLEAARADYRRLNSDVKVLEAAISKVPHLE